MIVITNSSPIANEISTIHSLFENGLELLHIRKPEYSAEELRSFLFKIKLDYSGRLVLHSHHHLAEELGINRLHFSESERKKKDQLAIEIHKAKGFHLSTSTHTIADFNTLNSVFEYAFLSPVFPSISKTGYTSNTDLFKVVKSRTNYTTKLIALGGIEPKNTGQTIENGFDSVALLGTIWNQNNPLENFKLCLENVPSS